MAKKPQTNANTTAPPNPWLNISWKDTIADCDKGIIYPLYCAKKGIDIFKLPEPFAGNVEANVYLLNENPGNTHNNSFFGGDKNFEKVIRENLRHKHNDFFWLRPILTCKNRVMHSGSIYWQDLTEQLRKAVGSDMLNIFDLEFFPYHSKSAFSFPLLPSDEYRNYLLCQAMKDGKLIVIMRGASKWFGIEDKGVCGNPLGQMLRNYPNKIILKNLRNPTLSPNNMSSSDWSKLVAALQNGNSKQYP